MRSSTLHLLHRPCYASYRMVRAALDARQQLYGLLRLWQSLHDVSKTASLSRVRSNLLLEMLVGGNCQSRQDVLSSTPPITEHVLSKYITRTHASSKNGNCICVRFLRILPLPPPVLFHSRTHMLSPYSVTRTTQGDCGSTSRVQWGAPLLQLLRWRYP